MLVSDSAAVRVAETYGTWEYWVEMEDRLANLSFLRAWIHKPAFPGRLYSGS